MGLDYWVSEITHQEHPLTLAQVRENFVVAQDEVAAQGLHDTPRSDVISSFTTTFSNAPQRQKTLHTGVLAYWRWKGYFY